MNHLELLWYIANHQFRIHIYLVRYKYLDTSPEFPSEKLIFDMTYYILAVSVYIYKTYVAIITNMFPINCEGIHNLIGSHTWSRYFGHILTINIVYGHVGTLFAEKTCY